MDFDDYAIGRRGQVDVVVAGGGLVVLAGIGDGGELVEQSQGDEELADAVFAALDPEVDVAGLSGELVGVEQGIGLALENGGMAACISKEPGEAGGFAILQCVGTTNGLGIGHPLHGEGQGELEVGHGMIDDAGEGLLTGEVVEGVPVGISQSDRGVGGCQG